MPHYPARKRHRGDLDVKHWGDRLLASFEIRSFGQAMQRTVGLTILITAAAVVISDVWLRTDYPELYPVIGLGNILSTIGIGIVLAGPLLFGFNTMALRLWRANQSLRRLANHDPLTGLLNRRAWAEEHAIQAGKARRKGETGYLMVIDADHFKQINDTHGHDVGDRVLQHLAGVIAASKDSNAICARLGGEEFAIAGHTLLDGRLEAEHLRACVSATPFSTGSIEIPLTVSIGLTLLAPDGSLGEAMRIADAALYEAKDSGRNRVCIATSKGGMSRPAQRVGSSHRDLKLASSN